MQGAAFQPEAHEKWDRVWKAPAFAAFLPLTLRTRLRIEALLLFMVLSAGAVIIVGGMKTPVSGGGHGELDPIRMEVLRRRWRVPVRGAVRRHRLPFVSMPVGAQIGLGTNLARLRAAAPAHRNERRGRALARA